MSFVDPFCLSDTLDLRSFPTRRSSDLHELFHNTLYIKGAGAFNESSANFVGHRAAIDFFREKFGDASAEHQRAKIGRDTSELQSPCNLVCRLLLEKKK